MSQNSVYPASTCTYVPKSCVSFPHLRSSNHNGRAPNYLLPPIYNFSSDLKWPKDSLVGLMLARNGLKTTSEMSFKSVSISGCQDERGGGLGNSHPPSQERCDAKENTWPNLDPEHPWKGPAQLSWRRNIVFGSQDRVQGPLGVEVEGVAHSWCRPVGILG